MEAIKKLSVVTFLLAGLLFNLNRVSAQCYDINYPIAGPTHAEVQSPSGIAAIMTTPASGFSCGTGGTALTYFGISNSNPQYITDILGNAIGDGVNVSGPSNNAVGYSIGGGGIGVSNMFLWHSGDITSVYCGIQAGFINSSTASAGTNNNTFVGYKSGLAFGGSGGQNNSFVGAYAGTANTGGAQNCAFGERAFNANTGGNENVAVGVQSVYSMLINNADVGVGYWALHSDVTGDNTAPRKR